MEPVVYVAVGGLVLLGIWLGATTRHVRGRERRGVEWHQAEAKPDLWTSSARCRDCGSHGGLLELDGERLQFVCLSCGARHAREARG